MEGLGVAVLRHAKGLGSLEGGDFEVIGGGEVGCAVETGARGGVLPVHQVKPVEAGALPKLFEELDDEFGFEIIQGLEAFEEVVREALVSFEVFVLEDDAVEVFATAHALGPGGWVRLRHAGESGLEAFEQGVDAFGVHAGEQGAGAVGLLEDGIGFGLVGADIADGFGAGEVIAEGVVVLQGGGGFAGEAEAGLGEAHPPLFEIGVAEVVGHVHFGAGFVGLGALQLERGEDPAVEEGFEGGDLGAVVFADGFFIGAELFGDGGGVGEEGFGGGREAVGKGVAGGGGFAFGATRAGGLLSVGLIGQDLLRSGHCCLLLSCVENKLAPVEGGLAREKLACVGRVWVAVGRGLR